MELSHRAVVVVTPPEHPVPVVGPPVPRPAAVIVPVPGERGKPGMDATDLTPEQLDELTADAQAAILAGLVPGIPFTVVFENALH